MPAPASPQVEMLVPDVEKILLEGKERRLSAKTRRETIERFRQTARPNVPSAIMYFGLALFQGGLVLVYISTRQVFGSWDTAQVFYLCGLLCGLACLFLGMGFRHLWVSPRDKLLLLLIEEALPEMKSESPESSCKEEP